MIVKRYIRNFYPRPPRGGRPVVAGRLPRRVGISIHALREEGDVTSLYLVDQRPISIHALREEGDLVELGLGCALLISIHALREEGDA